MRDANSDSTAIALFGKADTALQNAIDLQNATELCKLHMHTNTYLMRAANSDSTAIDLSSSAESAVGTISV
jgi:hypothetical protein